MGNPRSFTTKFNALTNELDAFVRSKAGRSITKRRQAMQRAAVLPNRLAPLPRAAKKAIAGSLKA
jgi:hypothetical protein